jgi:CheY-like chemotaxis protein
MRSLVIEDEPQIGAYLGHLLGQLRGIVDIVGSLSDAKKALGNFKYDLAIVDRMLPDGDALDIVMALSQLPERPAFIATAAQAGKAALAADTAASSWLLEARGHCASTSSVAGLRTGMVWSPGTIFPSIRRLKSLIGFALHLNGPSGGLVISCQRAATCAARSGMAGSGCQRCTAE